MAKDYIVEEVRQVREEQAASMGLTSRQFSQPPGEGSADPD